MHWVTGIGMLDLDHWKSVINTHFEKVLNNHDACAVGQASSPAGVSMRGRDHYQQFADVAYLIVFLQCFRVF